MADVNSQEGLQALADKLMHRADLDKLPSDHLLRLAARRVQREMARKPRDSHTLLIQALREAAYFWERYTGEVLSVPDRLPFRRAGGKRYDPALRRRAFDLRSKDFSVRHISQALGVPTRTVEQWLYRALNTKNST